VGGASIIDGDEQAVVTFWNKDGTQRFVVMGLSTTDDVRTELRTEVAATWAVLPRPLQ
jgi:hypothetical protein